MKKERKTMGKKKRKSAIGTRITAILLSAVMAVSLIPAETVRAAAVREETEYQIFEEETWESTLSDESTEEVITEAIQEETEQQVLEEDSEEESTLSDEPTEEVMQEDLELELEAWRQEAREELEKAEEVRKSNEEQAAKIVARSSRAILDFRGDGTEQNPYLIENAENLIQMQEYSDSGNAFSGTYFQLTADIDLNGGENGNSLPWSPISNFSGTFDGNGFMITGLYLGSQGVYQGLFGLIQDAEIKNLTVKISGQEGAATYSGVLAGSAVQSTVSGCSVQGELNTESEYAGGLVGYLSLSKVSGCRFAGTLWGKITGGIVGMSVDSDIKSCITSGKIRGSEQTGGIIGQLFSTPVTVQGIVTSVAESNYNKADVYGIKEVGGVIGSVINNGDSRIRVNLLKNANKGQVEAESIVGGLVGKVDGNITISDCYNNASVAALTASVAGGVIGRFNMDDKYASLSNCYNSGEIVAANTMMLGGIAGYAESMILKSYILANGIRGIGRAAGSASGSETNIRILQKEKLRDFNGSIQKPFLIDEENRNDGYPILDSIEYVEGGASGELEFLYASGSDQDYSGKCYYEDSYFYEDSLHYNPSLSTMSLSLAMSAFGSNEAPYDKKSKNADRLLSDIGFGDIRYNHAFEVKPERDSIGVIAGNKIINDGEKNYTLIAVAVRGAGYEAEWAGNFRLGEDGEHEGFSIARDQVISFLNDYVEEQNIENEIKIWITGYSRASAVVNLTAATLLRDQVVGGDKRILPGDIYAYGFEVPAGTLFSLAKDENKVSKREYQYIHNIINNNDPVPKVAPKYFDFTRYGIDHTIPTSSIQDGYEEVKETMLKSYQALDSTGEYVVDDFRMKRILAEVIRNAEEVGVKTIVGLGIGNGVLAGWIIKNLTLKDNQEDDITQDIFLEQTVNDLSEKVFVSRANYVENYQSILRDMMGSMYEQEPDKWKQFIKQLSANLIQSLINRMALATVIQDQSTKDEMVRTLVPDVKQCVKDSLAEVGIESISDETVDNMADFLTKMFIDYALQDLDATVTLIGNMEPIASAHYPELCLAWMQSMDPNFTPLENLNHFSNGSYRVLSVNCPVDVEVYDSSGVKVAAIIQDTPVEIEGSSIISSVNSNGEKQFFLPATESYHLTLTAVDNGDMTYTVNEFNPVVESINRIVCNYDVPLRKGDVFQAEVPAFDEADIENGTAVNGSGVDYTMRDPGNKVIEPDVNMTGEEAANAVYTIQASSENTKQGIVTGGGIVRFGSFVKVMAQPVEGYVLEGWYTDGRKVSEDAEYRFRAEGDLEITARFKEQVTQTDTTKKAFTEISTPGELRAVADNPTGSYKLVKDIDLEEEPWEPIQNFSGVFDGNGYKIQNLKIDKPDTENVGFFGSLTNALVRNVAIDGVRINAVGSLAVGVLAGKAQVRRAAIDNYTGSSILNCSVSNGMVSGGEHVGGLIGKTDKTVRIYRSYTDRGLQVKGVRYVGGLIGSQERFANQKWISDMYVEECYSDAEVTGVDYVGGMTGQVTGGNYKNCYSDGTVVGNDHVGGLFGEALFDTTTSLIRYDGVQYCHFSGTGRGFTSVLGINPLSEKNSIKNVYFTGDVTFTEEGNQALTEEAKALGENAYASYWWSSIWAKTAENKPYLIAVPGNWEDSSEPGTINNPYLVATAEELAQIRDNLKGHYKLVNDIDLAGIDWEPIGYFDTNSSINSEESFSGSLDGNGYTIRNAVIRGKREQDATGLFSRTQSAVFKNIRLENFDVRGNYWTAGLVALAAGDTYMENCTIDDASKIVGSYREVLGSLFVSYNSWNSGGLFGFAQNIRIMDCSSSAQIGDTDVLGAFSTEKTGGLGGAATKIIMQRCYFDGMIYGKKNVGGLIGDTRSGIFEDCFFDGKIKAYSAAMGLSFVASNAYLEVKNCYTTGTAEIEYKGYPFNAYGYHSDETNVDNCYYNKESLEPKYCQDTGRTEGELKKRKTFVDWDFNHVWYMEEGTSMPKLKKIEL